MCIPDPRSVVQVAAASMVEAVVSGQNQHPYSHHHYHHVQHPIKSEPTEQSGPPKTEKEEGKGNQFSIFKN